MFSAKRAFETFRGHADNPNDPNVDHQFNGEE
jgi:hypothetical protein